MSCASSSCYTERCAWKAVALQGPRIRRLPHEEPKMFAVVFWRHLIFSFCYQHSVLQLRVVLFLVDDPSPLLCNSDIVQ